MLLARYKIELLVDWITCENIIRRRAYCHLGRPSPSIPWVTEYCVYGEIFDDQYELVKWDEKLNSERYWQQLDHLNTALHEKKQTVINRKDIMLLDDNTTCYFSDSSKTGRARLPNSAASTILCRRSTLRLPLVSVLTTFFTGQANGSTCRFQRYDAF